MATMTIALGKVAYPHVTDRTEVLTAPHGDTEAVGWAVGFLWQRNTHVDGTFGLEKQSVILVIKMAAWLRTPADFA